MSQTKEEQTKQDQQWVATWLESLQAGTVQHLARHYNLIKWYETEPSDYLRTQLMLHLTQETSVG